MIIEVRPDHRVGKMPAKPRPAIPAGKSRVKMSRAADAAKKRAIRKLAIRIRNAYRIMRLYYALPGKRQFQDPSIAYMALLSGKDRAAMYRHAIAVIAARRGECWRFAISQMLVPGVGLFDITQMYPELCLFAPDGEDPNDVAVWGASAGRTSRCSRCRSRPS